MTAPHLETRLSTDRIRATSARPSLDRIRALGAALELADRDRFAGRHVATIVCGSNVDMDAYHRWVGA